MADHSDAFMRNNQNAAVQARAKAQNRANVLQLKLIGQSHPTGLTPNLLKLFEPRPPLDFKPPPEKRKCPPYTGMAQFVSLFAEPTDPEYAPPVTEVETRAQKKARIRQLRLDRGAAKAAEELEKYDPNNNPNATGDPYKTLFVAGISYETSESRLKREFETYGPIKRVKMVYDKETNKPRGYAFIEYAHTRDMKAAYKQGDGRKIDGRRVLVDVERGRTVPNWRPRRLGGGLGTSRASGEDGIEKTSGREKSRERVREKETDREKSRERSHDRPRAREHREDRHHRDRERIRDREKERDRDRDRGRDREKGRERSSRDHEKERDRGRKRGQDYEVEEIEHGRRHGHSYGRDYEYDYMDSKHGRDYKYNHMDSKHDRALHGEKDQGYEHGGPDYDQGWYNQSEHGHLDGKHYDYYDHRQGAVYSSKTDGKGNQGGEQYGHYAVVKDQCDQMKHYNYDPR